MFDELNRKTLKWSERFVSKIKAVFRTQARTNFKLKMAFIWLIINLKRFVFLNSCLFIKCKKCVKKLFLLFVDSGLKGKEWTFKGLVLS